jgi:hypothetical protein
MARNDESEFDCANIFVLSYQHAPVSFYRKWDNYSIVYTAFHPVTGPVLIPFLNNRSSPGFFERLLL